MSDVAAYRVFVCVFYPVQGGMWTGSVSPHNSLHWKQYTICCNITHNNDIFIILTRDFS